MIRLRPAVCLLSDHSLSPSVLKLRWSQMRLTCCTLCSHWTFPIAVPLGCLCHRSSCGWLLLLILHVPAKGPSKVLPWPRDLKSPVSLPYSVPLLCFIVIIEQYFSPSKLPSACWMMSHVPSRSPTQPHGCVFWKQLSVFLASSLPGFSLDFTLF